MKAQPRADSGKGETKGQWGNALYIDLHFYAWHDRVM